jgi:outer membrane immunogenic protein
MKTFLLASGALLLASAAPAFAQDSSALAPTTETASTVSTTTNFGGPRAEVFGGWDRVGTRTRFDDGTTRITDRSHKSGVTAGGLVGYDMPIGDRFIVGAFGSYAISSAKTCDFGNAGNVGNGCLKAGRELEGGARIGANLGGKALVYAKGAYVNGQIRGRFSDGTNYIGGHTNRGGWRAGAGVEYPVSSHAYVKAEYDYTRFKTFDATDLGVTDTSLRYDRSQVLGGFGVRF